MFHDNYIVRPYIYKFFRIDNGVFYNFDKVIYLFLVAIIIFVLGLIISIIRKLIIRIINRNNYIYNLLKEFKILIRKID